MAAWNRSGDVNGNREHSGGTYRPPLPPSLPRPDNGDDHYPVPLWEREFCRNVGNITWKRFCENKQYVSPFEKHEPWDDSEAFDCFQNAKSRFWANYHGRASHVPSLDDPDLYIDKVDHQCKVDPKLVAELDSVGLPFEEDNPAKVITPEAVWGGQSPNKQGFNGNTSLGAPLEKPSWRENHYSPNNCSNNFHGGPSNNRYKQPEDPSHTSGTGRQHQQQHRSGGWQQG